MTGLLTKLFPASRNRPARPASRKTSARLGIETLGDRIMPAVTSSLSAAGVLSVTGTQANDDVYVSIGSPFAGSMVVVKDNTTGSSSSFPPVSVKRIDFQGLPGNDRLQNATAIPSTFNGGVGSDTLIGGDATDIFYGSSGADQYYGGGEQDVLYRNGYHGYLRDAAARPTDYDLTVGQVRTPAVGGLNAEELRAAGSVTASLDPADKQRLVLNGPSGAAIVLKAAAWTKTTSAFETSSAVTMETDDGEVLFAPALSGGKKTVIKLYGSPVEDAGNLFGITSGGVPVTSGGTDALTQTIGGILDPIGALDLPQVSWGIKLGSELKAQDSDAPLNPAVPYLYASFASNSGNNAESGMIRMNLPSHGGNTFSGSVAYAPSDGTVYVAYGDYGFAVSANGYIPYTPDRIPTGVADPNIYGDVYLRGPILLGDYELDGEVVLDLDANGDGQRSALDAVSNKLTRFARGFQSQSVDEFSPNGFGASVLSDTAVGFNGTLSMGFVQGLVSVDIGDATAWYKPGSVTGATSLFAFRGSSPDPFEDMDKSQGVGKILAKLGAPQYDVQGLVTWKQGTGGDGFNWQFQASASTASFGGLLPAAGLTLYAGNTRFNGDAFYVQAYCQVSGFGNLMIQGSIAFGDESVYLYGQVDVHKRDDRGAFQSSLDMTAKLIVQWSENVFTLGGTFSFNVWAKQDCVGEGRISIEAELGVRVYGNTILFWGSGSISISAWVYVLDWHPEASAEFSFTNSSFAIDIPGLGDVEFDW